MRDIIEKLVALFCILVFLTFLINHGHLDFSGVDWVAGKAKDAVKSEQGQEYIEETKEISNNIFSELFSGIKNLITTGNSSGSTEKIILEEGLFVSVVDERTLKIKLDGAEKNVKLIGLAGIIDGNESKNQATSYLTSITENIGKVYIEYDVTKKDDDGNYLAYIWITNNPNDVKTEMINGIMLDKGYAIDTVYLPNNKYSDIFAECRLNAKDKEIGIWSK